jgi:hypothetical protein
VFVLVVFVYYQLGNDEILFEDRLNFFGLDKLIEAAAPPSPGSVKPQKNILVRGTRRLLGLIENISRGRGGHRTRNHQ